MTFRMGSRAVPYLLSLPALIFLAFLFVLPVGSLIVLGLFPPKNGVPGDFSFRLFSAYFTDAYSLKMLWTTFKLSLITTAISLVLGFPVALYLRQISPRWRAILAFVLLSPLLTSVVVRTLAWVMLLGPKGIINDALVWLGIGQVALIYNETGVVIGLVHVFFGYMALSLMASILKIDENLLLAATNLGANRWQVLWRIVLPLSLPGMLSGSILVFTLSASTYATPVLLGGSSTKMLSMEVYDLAIHYLEWGEAAVVATVLFMMVAIAVITGARIAEGGKRKAIFQ